MTPHQTEMARAAERQHLVDIVVAPGHVAGVGVVGVTVDETSRIAALIEPEGFSAFSSENVPPHGS